MLINLDERIKEYIESEIREKLKVKVNVSEGYGSKENNIRINVQLIFNDKLISETNDYHVL